MEGVTLIQTDQYNNLMSKIEDLHHVVMNMSRELEDLKSKWMTTRQVCKYLNKHENWVLLHKHELGSSKRAGTLLFKRSDVDKFIEEDYVKKNAARW